VCGFSPPNEGKNEKRHPNWMTLSRLLAKKSRRLLLVAALVTSLTKQLAVLLFRHALTTLFDDGTHENLTG
jgi:hypothetical protein